jgi:hypothetical protein
MGLPVTDIRTESGQDAQRGADHQKAGPGPGQTSLGDPELEGDAVARLFALLDVLEALRDLIATADRGDAFGAPIGRAAEERLLALLGTRLARQERVQEHVGHAAGRDGRERDRGDRSRSRLAPCGPRR